MSSVIDTGLHPKVRLGGIPSHIPKIPTNPNIKVSSVVDTGLHPKVRMGGIPSHISKISTNPNIVRKCQHKHWSMKRLWNLLIQCICTHYAVRVFGSFIDAGVETPVLYTSPVYITWLFSLVTVTVLVLTCFMFMIDKGCLSQWSVSPSECLPVRWALEDLAAFLILTIVCPCFDWFWECLTKLLKLLAWFLLVS